MDDEKLAMLERCYWTVQEAVYRAQAAAQSADMSFDVEWLHAVGQILDAADVLRDSANDALERDAIEALELEEKNKMAYIDYKDGKQQGRAELAACILNMILEGKSVKDIQQDCRNILEWEEDEDEET